MFEGIIGYEDTVVPQLANAILSGHKLHFAGTARPGPRAAFCARWLRCSTRRSLSSAGCEINDDPLKPICPGPAHQRIEEMGDATPIDYLRPEQRYVEKLATPDVTIADILGDLDPIKAARGGPRAFEELTIHYGLLPRANRGIFAINELPDLAGKIQVGPLQYHAGGGRSDQRLPGPPCPWTWSWSFTANPEDYTARGKIINASQGPHRLRNPHAPIRHARAGHGDYRPGGPGSSGTARIAWLSRNLYAKWSRAFAFEARQERGG